MSNYFRPVQPGAVWFFTVCLANRRSDLLVRHVDVLREVLCEVRRARPFAVDAIVVLPDHLHCLWTLPENDGDYARRWSQLKAAFTRTIGSPAPRSMSRALRRERGVWQRRYWEHLIRDQDDYDRHVEYIHFNPIKHGHVRSVADWPYSSFYRFVRDGMLPANWASAVDDDIGPAFGEPPNR